MADITNVYIRRYKYADIDVKQIRLTSFGNITIKYEDASDAVQVVTFDLSNLSTGVTYQPGNDHHFGILQRATKVAADKLELEFSAYTENYDEAEFASEIVSYPDWAYIAEDVATPTTDDTATHTGNAPTALTFTQKQELAVKSIKFFRSKMDEWMLEATERSHIGNGSLILERARKWLQAALYYLQLEYEDPNVDPITVEEMVNVASTGASDVRTVDEFFTSVYKNDTPPDVAALWIQKSNDTPPVITKSTLSAIDKKTNSVPTDYNTIDLSWAVPFQHGSLSLDITSPEAGRAMTVSITDPDGGITNQAYQWATLSSADDQSGQSIDGATSASYTPATGDIGSWLVCFVTYDDNAKTDNQLTIVTDSAVVA